VPVLPRLKVSVRIVSGAQFQVRFNAKYLLIGSEWMQVVNIQTGLDWIDQFLDYIALGQQKRSNVQLWYRVIQKNVCLPVPDQ